MVRVITLDEPFLPVQNDLGEGTYMSHALVFELNDDTRLLTDMCFHRMSLGLEDGSASLGGHLPVDHPYVSPWASSHSARPRTPTTRYEKKVMLITHLRLVSFCLADSTRRR